jgi:predicted lipoprotein with Yx(FWY)xxD motif
MEADVVSVAQDTGGVVMARLLRWLVVGVVVVLMGSVAVPVATATHSHAVTVRPVHVASTRMGKILVTAKGMTLYYNTMEKTGMLACTRTCTKVWSPLLLKRGHTLSSGKGLAGKLGTIMRPNGKTQVTYEGWPLYRYSLDKLPTEMLGQGIGGVWFVATIHIQPRSTYAGAHAGSMG